MTIQLSPEQERVIQEAIRSGVVHSVDEFIDAAIAMLRQPKDQNENSRREAVRRMEEFGESITSALANLSCASSCMKAIATDGRVCP